MTQELNPQGDPRREPEEVLPEFTNFGETEEHSGQTFEPDEAIEEFSAEKYDPIEAASILFDKDKNEVVDFSNIRPIEMIIAASKEKNIRIKPIAFKENGTYDTGCRRPNCSGRGYIGFNKEFPIPCQCMFYAEDVRESRKYVQKNRKVLRLHAKMTQAQSKAWKDLCAKNRNLKQVDSNVYVDSKKRKWKWIETGDQNSRFERILK